MVKIALAIVATLAAGIAIGAWVIDEREEPEEIAAAPVSIDENASDSERLRHLEQLIAEEREARAVLEDELVALYGEIDELRSSQTRQRPERAATTTEAREARPGSWRRNNSANMADRMRRWQDRRFEQLVDNGYSQEEARSIFRAESEAQLAAMQANWESLRNGESVDVFSSRNNPQSLLRENLGDAEYERYLKAQGQPAAVTVSSMIEGSPGARAGLKSGDQIVSYNGKRTFSMTDIREFTMQGDPGQDVVVEIERDGVHMQLTIPRGPIGMNGNGAAIRGMNWFGG